MWVLMKNIVLQSSDFTIKKLTSTDPEATYFVRCLAVIITKWELNLFTSHINAHMPMHASTHTQTHTRTHVATYTKKYSKNAQIVFIL